jgi:hypothetical protein
MKGRFALDETCEFQNLKIKSQPASKEIEGYRKKCALMPPCKKAHTFVDGKSGRFKSPTPKNLSKENTALLMVLEPMTIFNPSAGQKLNLWNNITPEAMAVAREGIKKSAEQISKSAKQLQQILGPNKVSLAGICDDNDEDDSSDEEDDKADNDVANIPTETEDVRQNLKMLQRMRKSSRPMEPNYGPLASKEGIKTVGMQLLAKKRVLEKCAERIEKKIVSLIVVRKL